MAATDQQQLLALLLPSKGRFLDLLLTLAFAPLKAPRGFAVKFVVCANYTSLQLTILRKLFSNRARFIDERDLEWQGMTGAYNYALAEATNMGATWAALWADDLLPEKSSWLDMLFPKITSPDFRLGIFSSDEGNHKGRFGWNIFAGYPCAHFFVVRIDALPGHMLNPKLKAYVSDNEIAISRIKAGIRVDLLPIRVIHQPTANSTRKNNSPAYNSDLESFYIIHPELRGKLDAIVLRGDTTDVNCQFVVDDGNQRQFGIDTSPVTLTIDAFQAQAQVTRHRLGIRVIGLLRKLWNEVLMSPHFALRSAVGQLRRRIRRAA